MSALVDFVLIVMIMLAIITVCVLLFPPLFLMMVGEIKVPILWRLARAYDRYYEWWFRRVK